MFNHSTRTKPKAQAMVEFALVLMLLLTLLYGILEAGRLLFIYASTVTAARQAVRYGSTTGLNASNVPYYADCAGIKQAVKAIGFIAPYSDSDIHVTYDRGLDSSGNPIPINTSTWPLTKECETVNWANPNNALHNGDRVRVNVSTNWQPVVNFINLNSFTITSDSARTIIANVSIEVTAAPQSWGGTGNGTLELQTSASPATYSVVGQVITFTYTLTNYGSGVLSSPFSVAANKAPSTCNGAPSLLSPGDSITCQGTYTITQADLDEGFVTNTATASAASVSSGQVSTTITAAQNPGLSLSKSASPTNATSTGTIITYTYTLTNSGNVTLKPPYTITDNKVSGITCSSSADLAPGASTSCVKDYSITSADMNAGFVTNQARGTALFDTQTIYSDFANATVITSQIGLSVSPSHTTITQAGQTITYTYTIRNYTGSSVNSPAVSDNKASVNCSGATNPLPSGASTTCVGTYTVSQTDMDDGGNLTNQAIASVNSGAITSNTVTTSIPITQSPVLGIASEASPSTATTVGMEVTFTYTLTNSGNVTLSGPYTVNSLIRNGTVTIPVTCSSTADMPPGGTVTCEGKFNLIQADIDGGYVINHATGNAKFSSQTITSAQQTTLVATYNGPRLALQIAAEPTAAPQTGTMVNFTYTLRNTGNTPLTAPYTVSASKENSSVNCMGATSPLGLNASTTCVGSYTTNSTDTSADSFTNTATATAMSGTTTITSNTASITIPTAAACRRIRTSELVYSGNTMRVDIENTTGLDFMVTMVSGTWNHDTGHLITNGNCNSKDCKLKLTSLQIGVYQILSGASIYAPSYSTNPNGVYVTGSGVTTTIFTFHQSYDVPEAGDNITLNLYSPVCGAKTFSVSRP